MVAAWLDSPLWKSGSTNPGRSHDGGAEDGLGRAESRQHRQDRATGQQNGQNWRSSCCRSLLRGAGAGQEAHQQPEIVAGDMEEMALARVLAAAQPSPTHAAAIEDMSERAFGDFGTQPNTAARISWGRQPRVLEGREWSGTRSRCSRCRISRSDRLSAHRRSIPRFESLPYK